MSHKYSEKDIEVFEFCVITLILYWRRYRRTNSTKQLEKHIAWVGQIFSCLQEKMFFKRTLV